MKTRKLLRNLLIVPCLALLMTACKKNEPQFGFYAPQWYFVQQDEEAGTFFYPSLVAVAVNGELQQFTIKHNSTPLTGRTIVANTYETSNGANFQPSITALNGTYTFEATSMDNKVASISQNVTLLENQKIGEMTVSEFTYKDGRVSAKIKADNAKAYLFLIHPVLTSGTRVYDTQSIAVEAPAGGSEMPVSTIINSVYPECDRLVIYPVAANQGIYKLGEPKILEKEGTGWKDITNPVE